MNYHLVKYQYATNNIVKILPAKVNLAEWSKLL